MVLHSRRRVLQSGLAVGAASLAGCAFGFGSETECPEGRTLHESDVALPGTAAWPTFQYDAANSGYNPDASGPTGDVEIVWRYSACTEADSGVLVADGRACAGGFVVNAETGRASGGEWHGHMSTPTVADGTLYVGASDLVARDATTGEVQWTFQTDADAGALAPPTVASGTVYVPGNIDDSTVYAVDADDGTERWRFGMDADSDGPVAVADRTAYVVDASSTVYALDAETGDERWRASPNADLGWAVPTAVGERLYLGSQRGALALRTTGGSTAWHQREHETDVAVRGPVAVAEGTAFGASGDGTFAALDATSGQVEWSVATEMEELGVPAVAEGVVYVGAGSEVGSSGTLLALDWSNGEELWRVETREVLFGDYVRSGINGSPAVVDGAVYVATAPGDIYAVVGG